MNRKISVVTLVVVLALVNWSIFKKEKHLEDGIIVLLELAPVDPRSLMQGDFMALRYKISDQVYNTLPKKENSKRWRQKVDATDGYAVVQLDSNNVGNFKYIYSGQPLKNNEIKMHYRVRKGQVKFATNAFFFQEGHAKYYQAARYGQFRVDDSGELLLVAMFDKSLQEMTSQKP